MGQLTPAVPSAPTHRRSLAPNCSTSPPGVLSPRDIHNAVMSLRLLLVGRDAGEGLGKGLGQLAPLNSRLGGQRPSVVTIRSREDKKRPRGVSPCRHMAAWTQRCLSREGRLRSRAWVGVSTSPGAASDMPCDLEQVATLGLTNPYLTWEEP